MQDANASKSCNNFGIALNKYTTWNSDNNNNNGNFIEMFYTKYNCKSHLTGNLQLAT